MGSCHFWDNLASRAQVYPPCHGFLTEVSELGPFPDWYKLLQPSERDWIKLRFGTITLGLSCSLVTLSLKANNFLMNSKWWTTQQKAGKSVSLTAALFQTMKIYYLFHISKPIPLLFPESLSFFGPSLKTKPIYICAQNNWKGELDSKGNVIAF